MSQIQEAVESHTSATFCPLNMSAMEFVLSNPAYRREQSVITNHLPKLNLPTFAGDPLTWQSFWDSFDTAVNSNTALDGVQKLNYLWAKLHGDAS